MSSTREQILNAATELFSEKGFDGILIVRTKSVDNIATYVPGKTHW